MNYIMIKTIKRTLVIRYFFRDFVIYEVYNEKLKAIVGGDIFFWNYIVNIKIEYKFESNMLVVDKIYFDVTEYFKD